MRNSDPLLLEVENLSTWFHTRDGIVKAVDGVSFVVGRGEVLGLVGESGCGKSVTSLSIMGLVPSPGRNEGGQVRFNGRNILEMSSRELESLRGERISMIFQQPQSSLNPVTPVGIQLSEVFEIHRRMKRLVGRKRAAELLARVGIPDPIERADAYAHELSGGMAQRVMIAMALALEPELLIADEPTTALDVTIQAQILDLIRNLRRDSDTAVILITHDLGVVAEIADRVGVMYAGEIVEEAKTAELFEEPKHPYTQGLIKSIPILGRVQSELDVIPGYVPNLMDLPTGCRFADRCQARVENQLEVCEERRPGLVKIGKTRTVRCWLYDDSCP